MSPLDALSPDQRAVIQLVLQQERSYDDLASLLGIPAESVRSRAVAGLQSLAPAGAELAADHRAVITDYLLGQLTVSERESARRFLSSTPEAREWALDVADELRELAPDALPEIPSGDGAAAADTPAAAEAPPVEAAAAPGEATPTLPPAGSEPFEEVDATREPAPALAEPPRPRPRPRPAVTPAGADVRPRSSRLGGALLIAGLAIVIAAVLIKVLTDDGDDGEQVATQTPTATRTATGEQPQELFSVPLEEVGNSGARGTMGVFRSDQQVFFQLAAERVPAPGENEAYAIWLIGGDEPPRRLGYFQDGVQNGQLGTIGPSQEDIPRFPRWLTQYRRIVISRETRQDARQPGPIILQGRLPDLGGG